MTEPNPWRDAVDDALVVSCLDSTCDDESPRDALARLIEWHVQIALDPSVSLGAAELLHRGCGRVRAYMHRSTGRLVHNLVDVRWPQWHHWQPLYQPAKPTPNVPQMLQQDIVQKALALAVGYADTLVEIATMKNLSASEEQFVAHLQRLAQEALRGKDEVTPGGKISSGNR
jgi:hypothetical protein